MFLAALLMASTAHAVEFESADGDTTLTLEGYYRFRVQQYGGLYDPAAWDDLDSSNGRYSVQRLRLEPSLNFSERAKVYAQIDALDNTLMGDNEDFASTALFAGNGSWTGVDGQPGDNVVVKRAWTRFSLPVGTMLVGRMESHWGMGLLANDGNDFRNTWGESYGGSSFDRILFATKPLAITEAAFGFGSADIPLVVAVGIDRLVEDPLTQYYGYQCDPDDEEEGCGSTEDHGYTEDRDTEDRRDNWWYDNEDDVYQLAYVVSYKGQDLNWGNKLTDFTLGALAFNRHQRETDSAVWVLDAHTRLNRSWLYVESEGYAIVGETRALALPDSTQEDPLHKEVKIWGAAAKAGYQTPDLDLIMEYGIASGDEYAGDSSFTGRPFHADYNVGLLLYEEILAYGTRYQWRDAADGLWSRGGVYNSSYLFPQVRYQLIPGWNLHGAFLVAMPHKPDGAIIRTDDDAESALLGWEVDAALKIDFQEQMKFSLEGGYAKTTDRLPTEIWGIAENGSVWTVQSRIAYSF
ncbi:MAG: hypothetical protein VX899_05355 [Myxococcota bacterium]|nr:hypothetical protein [Myxococcota bacterium]